ncbi:hypothetical protein GA0074695_0517 [Micromonospora viridifaciens]|uniref:Uncharacterized protein n=1 Tax=Micromonospora viridifaciens TaxID=1881 RepID=A0A1C4UIE0_MICVI|nr:hypothetical protein [Micromonospora viridifaciens]SCE71428.1 hypothetical protein GA0074695_0517 [Micromonospora viridifaciens]
MGKFRTILGVGLAGACALAVTPATASAAPVSTAGPVTTAGLADTTGAYYPISPARLMDTRSGVGAPKAKIGAGAKVDLQVTARGGVPAYGAGAVVLNVTIVNPTADSFVTAYPAGEARPDASSVNFAKGWLGSNNVTVKLGSGGKVSIYNRNGSTDVVVDVVGFYAKDNSMTNRNGGQYEWLPQFRLWDTREDPEGKPVAGEVLEYSLDFDDPNTAENENTHVKTIVFNLTAVSPAANGYLTAWSGATARTTASTVNYLAGVNVPNMAYVQTTPCTAADGWCEPGAPKFKIYTHASAHVLVDLVGVVDDGWSDFGLRFKPMSPTRIVDSRINMGISGALNAGSIRQVTVPAGMMTPETAVLNMNLTGIKPTKNTVITVWPGDYFEKPDSSNLNPYANQIVSNGVLGVVEPGRFSVHNHTGSTHVVVDVTGSFYYPNVAAAKTAGARDAASRPQPVASSHR